MTPGRKTTAAHLEELRQALKMIDDPISLEELALAKMRVVQLRAQRDFARRTCSLGLATRAVLKEALEEIADSLSCLSPLARLAHGLADGASQRAVAKQLHLSDEQLSRHWKRLLLRVLYDKLQMMNKEVDEFERISDN